MNNRVLTRHGEIKQYWHSVHIRSNMTLDVLNWLNDGEKIYLQGLWYKDATTIYFSLEDDAILFKLTWL